MSENSTCLGSGQGVGPVGRPSTMRIGASGLSGKPNRVSMNLKLAAIWGMSVYGINGLHEDGLAVRQVLGGN
jgi:hypothetical protein